MIYFFNLRKDLTNINYIRLLNSLQISLYNEQINTERTRSYINTLIDSDTAINNNINQKADILYVDNSVNQKADISYVDNTISNISTIPSNISDTINSYVEEALYTINIEKQQAIDEINSYSYGGATGNISLSSLNNALNSAISQINNIKGSALEEITHEKNNALSEINMLSENVSNHINGLNDSIKEDLLRRIDYLFEMFYHANSDIIIELYPL